LQASIAILNATLNISAPGVSLGDELDNVKSFSTGLDPRTTGEIVTNSHKIRYGQSAIELAAPHTRPLS
jgi:hypothetical protein